MNIYKLKYENKESGIADLIEKGIINEDLQYNNGTIAVVYIDEFHIDLMTSNEINFNNEVHPTTPNHVFAGMQQQESNDEHN